MDQQPSSSEFLFCYNPKLSKHLSNLGIRYITKGISPKEKRIFTLYYKNKELQEALDSYQG
ncbi:hypothetical protein CIL05_07385 [Virgibacillus profundi]|uniref:DUF5659 domain-containing protein n=1 Tax=Virgibacillus profundi TaxID=2024555 RepID=A0A2A2IGR9_9BACI|nr:hypothetical protein CIL05_07385 [Virgibacillus profundi]PXY54455.1 hypothetical protein CIT14_07470 [Virgibacillus profundi]